jgi:hypothetical protein
VINSAGVTLQRGNFIIGNPNPDFIINTSNSLSYKGFNLSMLMSYTAGEIFTRKLLLPYKEEQLLTLKIA